MHSKLETLPLPPAGAKKLVVALENILLTPDDKLHAAVRFAIDHVRTILAADAKSSKPLEAMPEPDPLLIEHHEA